VSHATGIVYARPVHELPTLVSLARLSADAHLESFHAWMNNPRVSAFWELEGSREQHAEYVRRILENTAVEPLIGNFDGQPFAYFEAYWAERDRIAPYYDVRAFDRGIHMLVGEERYRGPGRVKAWMLGLLHYLFLSDPRTERVVSEPRSDNTKMIGYLEQAGFVKLKEFDFPHKRAALMMLERDAFFERNAAALRGENSPPFVGRR
jgi:acetyl CoA:N6-hydroxylysine acetyl transferase